MPYFTDRELAAMLTYPESTNVERKESWSGTVSTKAREAVCAFANDLANTREPGVLFIGVHDDGRPSGLEITDALLLSLTDMSTDGNILPLPSLSVYRRELDGVSVAVVVVQPADNPPVRYKGRIWVRNGPRRSIATAQDERLLNEKRLHGNRPFDILPAIGATLSALSLVRFVEEYLPRAFAPDVIASNDRSVEQRLAATSMVVSAVNAVPTHLGVLVLSPSPQLFVPGAYVQFLRFSGTDKSAPVVFERVVQGPISSQVEKIESAFEANNAKAIEFLRTPLERAQWEYPPGAFAQLFRNAIMHRNYDTSNAPTRVDLYTDRLEIISPGGPFGDVTAERFADADINDYRNPNLAAAMKDLGLVQSFGLGIHQAHAAMRDAGNPPLEFDVSVARVRVVMRPHPHYSRFTEPESLTR